MEKEFELCEKGVNDGTRPYHPISMLDFVEFLSSSSDSDIDIIEDEAKNKPININETDYEEPRNYVNEVADAKKAIEKKKEILNLIHQLHTHIVLLEKERKSLLQSKSRMGGRVYYSELEEVESKYNVSRRKEKGQIQENLNRISTKISRFSREKAEARKSPLCIEKLKLLMEDIEENIMQFKEKQRMAYEELMVDSKSLTNEVEAFENKINLWQQAKAIVKPVNDMKKQEKEKEAEKLPKEVDEFENFLKSTGGHQGGWDDIDHQTFLRLRKQHKKSDQLLNACIRDIPTQESKDIEQHIEWYEEYCILRECKREAIRHWKNLKESEREDKLRNVEVISVNEEKKRKKREELHEKERKARLQELRAYKVHKQQEEEKQRREKEDLQEQVKERLKINQMIEEQKRLELKLQVEEYKMKKKEEGDILRQAQCMKAMEQKQIISEAEKNRIKERNDRLLSSKQQQKRLKEQENEEKEKRLENLKKQVSVNVARDPSRLFKLTAGWQHRKEDNTKSDSVLTGSRLMPQRAVPSWRQGMNV